MVLPFTFIGRGESTQLVEGVGAGGVGEAGVGACVEGLGSLPPNKVDCEKRLLKEFRFGRTVSRSEALVTPSHCATPFHTASQGVVGMQIPGSNIRSPPSRRSG